MRDATAPPFQGIYRTAARSTADPPPPRPRWRTLLSPLAGALRFLAIVLLPPILFNAIVAPLVLSFYEHGRFVPVLDFVQDGIAIGALGSFLALAVVFWRRVRPSWSGMRLRAKVPYVAALVVAQLLVVAVGEGVLFVTRGGPHLFEPRLTMTSVSPDLRTAYVYEGGLLGCTYELYVAPPMQPVMTNASTVLRSTCNEPKPHVKWDGDTPRLVDAAGNVLESQTIAPLFRWGGC